MCLQEMPHHQFCVELWLPGRVPDSPHCGSARSFTDRQCRSALPHIEGKVSFSALTFVCGLTIISGLMFVCGVDLFVLRLFG